ncbi:MAG: YceI family protein [Verrucomicrobiales bacterium]
MTHQELQRLGDKQLLDVRLADDFEAAHLPGSVNNCVFEVAFTERLADCAPDKSLPTIVCGANEESQEARMAYEKLERLGYRDLHLLAGGIAAASELERGQPLPHPPRPPHGLIPVDHAESRLRWTGRNLLNEHHGHIALASGELDFEHGSLRGGRFVIDLARISCDDLAGSDLHQVLINHLHDHDFFDLEHHPTAELVIVAARELPGASPGAPNLALDTELTLRGQCHPFSFEASTGLTEDGRAAAQARFSFDRTRWGIIYGSGKFFHRLAGHLVNDLIEMELRIVTQKPTES